MSASPRCVAVLHGLLIINIAGMLYACGGAEVKPSSAPKVAKLEVKCERSGCSSDQQHVMGLLRYAEYLRSLSPAEIKQEYETVEQDFFRSRADVRRLQLAMLLSAAESPNLNYERARTLLVEYVRANTNGDNEMFFLALALLRNVEDRQAMTQNLDAERRQRQQLRKQLDELRAIEKQINERERTDDGQPKP